MEFFYRFSNRNWFIVKNVFVELLLFFMCAPSYQDIMVWEKPGENNGWDRFMVVKRFFHWSKKERIF